MKQLIFCCPLRSFIFYSSWLTASSKLVSRVLSVDEQRTLGTRLRPDVALTEKGALATTTARNAYFLFVNCLCHFYRSMATICNQALNHDRCNIFPGLSFNMANNTFVNSLSKNNVEAQIQFTSKVTERAGQGYLLLMYQLRKTVCQFIFLIFPEFWLLGVVVQW